MLVNDMDYEEVMGLYFEMEPIRTAIRNFEEKGEFAIDKHVLCSIVKEALYKPLKTDNELKKEFVIEVQSKYEKDLRDFARFYVEFVNELVNKSVGKKSGYADTKKFVEIIDKYYTAFSKNFPSLQGVFNKFKEFVERDVPLNLANISKGVSQAFNIEVSPVLLLRVNKGTLPNPIPEEAREEGKSPLYICSGPFTESLQEIPGVMAQREVRIWVTSMSNFALWVVLSEFIRSNQYWRIYITTGRLSTILNEIKLLTLSTKKSINAYNHYFRLNLFTKTYSPCLVELKMIFLKDSEKKIRDLFENLKDYDPLLLIGTQFTICKGKGFKFVLVIPGPNSTSESSSGSE